MNSINITILENGTYSPDIMEIGIKGENLVSELVFTLPPSIELFSKWISFKFSDMTTTEYVLPTNNIFPIPYEILQKGSQVKILILCKNADGRIWYSSIINTTVGGSFSAELAVVAEHKDVFTQFIKDIVDVHNLAVQIFNDATTSTANALSSASNATSSGLSATNSLTSETNAKTSETNSKTSETNSSSSATIAANNILNGVNVHDLNSFSHADLRALIIEVEAIARGRATAHVYNNYAEMIAWLAIPANVLKLGMGDNLWIRAVGVDDYWWDGTSPQKLEAESPNFVNYYTLAQINGMMPITKSRTEYNLLVSSGTTLAGRTYHIYEG